MFAESPGSNSSRKRKIEEISDSHLPTTKRSHMTLRLQTPDRTVSTPFRGGQQRPYNEVVETSKTIAISSGNESSERERQKSLEVVGSAAIRLSESPTKADSLPSTDATMQGETSPIIDRLGDEQIIHRTNAVSKVALAETVEVGEEVPESDHRPTQHDGQKPRKRAQKVGAKKGQKDNGHRSDEKPTMHSVAATNTPSKPHTLKASTHRRFDSEEPEPISQAAETGPARQEDTKPQPVIIEDDDTSDSDAAPEAIPNTTSLHHAHSTAHEISKAIAHKAAADKAKRRKRAEALSLQAQKKSSKRASSKRKRSSSSSSSPPAEPAAPATQPTTRLSVNDPLPDLLPDYILASTPGERLPTPPPPPLLTPAPNAIQKKKPNKMRFLDREARPPKDVRRGDVIVRVLESRGTQNLPPRASRSSRCLREGWLSGKRGAAPLERRSWKGGFVRR